MCPTYSEMVQEKVFFVCCTCNIFVILKLFQNKNQFQYEKEMNKN